MPSDASSNGKWANIREAVDVRTGMKYFYDRYTRETFWIDPRVNTRDAFDESTGIIRRAAEAAEQQVVARSPALKRSRSTTRR